MARFFFKKPDESVSAKPQKHSDFIRLMRFLVVSLFSINLFKFIIIMGIAKYINFQDFRGDGHVRLAGVVFGHGKIE